MHALLPGLQGMLNHHPLFVHFPIALWLGALLFEALAALRSHEDLHDTAARLLYLGTLSAFFAVGTGWAAEGAVPPAGPAFDTKELHEKLMLGATSLAVGLCMLAFFTRRKFAPRLRKLFLAGLVLLACLLTLGADRGAMLVFQYATSVHLPAAPK